MSQPCQHSPINADSEYIVVNIDVDDIDVNFLFDIPSELDMCTKNIIKTVAIGILFQTDANYL